MRTQENQRKACMHRGNMQTLYSSLLKMRSGCQSGFCWLNKDDNNNKNKKTPGRDSNLGPSYCKTTVLLTSPLSPCYKYLLENVFIYYIPKGFCPLKILFFYSILGIMAIRLYVVIINRERRTAIWPSQQWKHEKVGKWINLREHGRERQQ